MRKTILVTAGPTREKIDPIRYISNESSGQLGFEIAKEAKRRGHRVILILGPTHLPVLDGVQTVHIQSAAQLLKTLKKFLPQADVLFMSAAVADFTAARPSSSKIKRDGDLKLHLKKTPDILQTVSVPAIKKNKIYVGFCLETDNLMANAQKKLASKRLDYMVATKYSARAVPFGNQKFSPVVLSSQGQKKIYSNISKADFAKEILMSV